MEERLQRVIADLKAIEEALEQTQGQAPSAVASIRDEALKELKTMAEKVRRLLWCCHVAKNEDQGGKAQVLEIYCTQRIVDLLRAHRNRVGVRH